MIFLIISVFLSLLIFAFSGNFMRSFVFTLFTGSLCMLILHFLNPADSIIFSPMLAFSSFFYGIPGIIGSLILFILNIL